VGLGRGTLSLVSTIEELRKRKIVASVYKTENTAVRFRSAELATLSIRKICTNFAEKQLALSSYSSLAD
jgi:hypothetical protein